MPLYEYQCRSCGGVFEVMQKFSDEPLTVHDGCGGPVHRLLSAPALQFKGSGWYITDYARAGAKGGNGKEAASGDAAKTESKTPEKAPASTDSASSASTKKDSA